MTPAQLYDGILKAMNDKEAIELIEKAKKEWCKEQRGNCLEEFNKGIDELIKGRDVEVQNLILNAPEP